uniref:Ascaphin-6 n=1 Tax=Ascaphus truei TaxID=8439 RepID=ASCA6_ASCTR|nr:RecName: Full=Ascaphin-6 [Ascaphus truei]
GFKDWIKGAAKKLIKTVASSIANE